MSISKFAEYARSVTGVLDAVLSEGTVTRVDLVERIVEVYSDPAQGSYQTSARFKAGATIAPRDFPEVTIDVSSLLP